MKGNSKYFAGTVFKFCLAGIFMLGTVVVNSQTKNPVIDSLEKLIAGLEESDRRYKEKATLLLKYFTTGQQEKGLDLLNETMDEARSNKSEYGLAMMYHTRGTLLYYESKFDSAIYNYERAIDIRKRIGDKEGMLKSISNIAGMKYLLTDYEAALKLYEEGLKLEEDLGYEEGTFLSLNNLGNIFSTLKVYRKALSCFQRSEKLLIKTGRKTDLIFTYDGFAMAYHELKMNDSALYFALKARDLAEELNEELSLSYELLSIGLIYLDMKEFDRAREYFLESLNISLYRGDKRLQLGLYGNLAIVEMEKKDYDAANEYLEKVVRLQAELGVPTNYEDQPKLFAEYHYRKKEYEKACNYLKAYANITDSVYRSDITNQLSEMRTRYETEKKEKENQLLQSENKGYKLARNFLGLIIFLAFAGIAGAGYSYNRIRKANKVISGQKVLVEEKQNEILDSINYARRIQFSLLASDKLLKANLPDHFIFFRPKDVVSGDFYWGTPVENGFMLITADCTGHGVPGAFMSLLNIGKLSRAINEYGITRPDLTLNYVREEIIRALNPDGSDTERKDGMDAILCKFDFKNLKLEYAAANNSFYIARKGKLIPCKADKMPVGKSHGEQPPFTYNSIDLEQEDIVYTFTDGLADQFGGLKGKKFKYKQLEEFLLAHSNMGMPEQRRMLESTFEAWKGHLEQVDDICVIGVRIT